MRENNAVRIRKILEKFPVAHDFVRTSGVRKIRRFWLGIDDHYRLLTASFRLLPDFLIIGAQRSGTTSFYSNLIRHPNILAATRKEVHYFSRSYDRGLNWYRMFFPYSGWKWLKPYWVGEASPAYLFYPECAQRIANDLGSIKAIALLRNPVRRAYSHYHHMVKNRLESREFSEAIRTELEMHRSGVIDWGSVRWGHTQGEYLLRGIYVDQIRNWLRFFSENDLLILRSEDYYADANRVLCEALEFLGVENQSKVVYQVEESQKTSYFKPMDPDVFLEIHEFFRPYNNQLYEYVGRDFGWIDSID